MPRRRQGSLRGARPRPVPARGIACGRKERGLDDAAERYIDPAVPPRVFGTPDGARWMATLVARIRSEDVASGATTSRLILCLECLSVPGRAVRTASVRASALEELDDRTLAALVSRSGTRKRSGRRR